MAAQLRRLLLALALAAATPAAAAEPLLPQVARCTRDADLALCLLRVVAAQDGGRQLWRDEELRAHPDLLARLGVTADSVARARAADPIEAMMMGSLDQADDAVRQALALDRAGQPPEVALAPILALSTRPPDAPAFFAPPGGYPAARVEGYLRLFRIGEQAGDRPGPGLGRAAALAWERDLQGPGLGIQDRRGAHGLALAWAQLGDPAGVARALALLATPEDRIETLAALGRLDEAVAAALALTPQQSQASARAELTDTMARIADLNEAAAAAADQTMARRLAELRARIDPEAAKVLERELARQQPPPPLPRTPSRDDVAEAARQRLRQVHEKLLHEAARLGRPAAVRPLADRLLEARDLPDDRPWFVKVVAATPARAEARLSALEAELTPRRGADRLATLVDGWRAAGQPARAAALLAKAQAWAAQPGSAYARPVAEILLTLGRTAEAEALAKLPARELLKSDIRAGRGLQNFDAYLARTTSPIPGVVELVAACSSAAIEAGAFDLLDDCAERRRQLLTAPFQRRVGAHALVSQAAAAAKAGQLTVARRLLALSAEESAAALAADPKVAETPESVPPYDLVEIAKAELRADGRLPKLPPPPPPRTMLSAPS